ncbi:MAG: hypothetical protein GWN00_01260 [Aliifodinibius sp.]|nr:hypothetical protein [Fodinibius sp.]NIV09960.1 hypothetical protein [Fodinibius sp.]NIY23490.1 hypothetical protein [Fodinibius sp.]
MLKFKPKKEEGGQELASFVMQDKVQEFIDLGRKIDDHMDAISDTVDRHKELKAEILEHMESYPADKKVTLPGHGDMLEGGPKANKSSLVGDNSYMLDNLGQTMFIQLANFSITDLKKYLEKNILEKVIKTERLGARKLRVK